MRHRRLNFSLLLAIVLAVPPIGAQQAASEARERVSISRAVAVERGAAQGPGVAVASAPLAASQDAVRATGQLLRPAMLTLTGGFRRAGGTSGPELGVSVSQEVPLADVRGRRSDLARAWIAQSRQERRQMALEAATRAALAWSSCLEADALQRLRQESKSDAERIWRLSRVRLKAGTGLPADEALARSDLAAASVAALDSEGSVVEAYAELRLALGEPVGAPLMAVGTLDDDDAAPVVEAFPAGAVEASPELSHARARAQLARSQTELVSATLGPSVVFGAAYLREGGGAQVVTGFVGLPLPFTQPASFERARERGQELRAEAEVAQVRNELEKTLSLAAHDRVHWRETARAIGLGVSAAEQALRITLANFEAGTHDVSPVLIARQRWLSAREQATHAAGEVQRADIRFAALTGRLLERDTR